MSWIKVQGDELPVWPWKSGANKSQCCALEEGRRNKRVEGSGEAGMGMVYEEYLSKDTNLPATGMLE